jgi:hypothetical protein
MKACLKFALILLLSVLLAFYFNHSAYSQSFSVGQKHRGGIVFYVDSTGLHGLIAATADQGKTLGRMGRSLRNSDRENSKLYPLTSSKSQENLDDATIASRVCSYYITTVKDVTYHTWYLPSMKELHLLYAQKSVVGGFKDDFYWSSTVNNMNELARGPWLLDFSKGNNYRAGSNCEGYIRPIQAF